MEETAEAGIIADGIKKWVHLYKLEHVGLLLVGLLQPHKCLFVVADPQIRIHHGAGRNVSFRLCSSSSASKRKASARRPAWA